MALTLEGTPRGDGFRMPGEFEPHRGCWMLWPERTDNWRLGAKPAQKAFSEVASAIVRFEPVTVGVSAAQFHCLLQSCPDRLVECSPLGLGDLDAPCPRMDLGAEEDVLQVAVADP